MPDEVSFLGLAGTSDLINAYSFEIYLFVNTLLSSNNVHNSCFSSFHKGRDKSEAVL